MRAKSSGLDNAASPHSEGRTGAASPPAEGRTQKAEGGASGAFGADGRVAGGSGCACAGKGSAVFSGVGSPLELRRVASSSGMMMPLKGPLVVIVDN